MLINLCLGIPNAQNMLLDATISVVECWVCSHALWVHHELTKLILDDCGFQLCVLLNSRSSFFRFFYSRFKVVNSNGNAGSFRDLTLRISFTSQVPRCPCVCKWLIRMPLCQLESGEHHRCIQDHFSKMSFECCTLWTRSCFSYQLNLRNNSCLFFCWHGNNWGGLWVSSRLCDDHVEGMASHHFVAASVLDAHEELWSQHQWNNPNLKIYEHLMLLTARDKQLI